jgi:glycine/D-amino acid oxidase-like deaminating enzyme
MGGGIRRLVVIGGGIAGLCAAVYARRRGYDLELLEQHDRLGGLATGQVEGFETPVSLVERVIGRDRRLRYPIRRAHLVFAFKIRNFVSKVARA